MTMTFPGESAEYRAARDLLLEREIELRRTMEAVAAARRALPPGGLVPEDYAFEEGSEGDESSQTRLSELFAPGKDSLVIYSFMFPRDPGDDRPGPATGEPRCCRSPTVHAPRASACSTSSTAPSNMQASTSISPWSQRLRLTAC
jgi:predicted dithiol-disulfide oxidoreductase (DUF899 family)